MNALVPLENPCLSGLVSQTDIPILQRGMDLINMDDPDIGQWISKRKSDLETINQVAEEALRVKDGLASATEAVGQATDQVEQSDSDRKDVERREAVENAAYNRDHKALQGRLRAADRKLQDHQRMFSFKNPLYSEWGMKYGPHALTATLPLLTYFHWDNLTENCSEFSMQCVHTLSDQWIAVPVVVATVATVLFARAAIKARPLLKDVSGLRAEARRFEESHRSNKDEFAREKGQAESEHKEGIAVLRSAKAKQDELSERQEATQEAMNSIRGKILGEVYKRNVEQLRDVFVQLDKDDKNGFARKMGTKAMQNVVDLMVTAFSSAKPSALEGGASAYPQIEALED